MSTSVQTDGKPKTSSDVIIRKIQLLSITFKEFLNGMQYEAETRQQGDQ
jgi:hypothetical protein